MSDKLRSRVLVSTQGRITIPDEIRAKHNIKKDTLLEMESYGKDEIRALNRKTTFKADGADRQRNLVRARHRVLG